MSSKKDKSKMFVRIMAAILAGLMLLAAVATLINYIFVR